MTDKGLEPPQSADKTLAEIVSDVSRKTSLLVREEIELAKAEVATKAKRFGAAVAAGLAAGVFVFYSVIFFFLAIAGIFIELVGLPGWLSYLITFAILILLAAIAGLIAFRLVRRALPPAPEMAIEEAKRTRAAIEEVRR
jgi:hypothetical protein